MAARGLGLSFDLRGQERFERALRNARPPGSGPALARGLRRGALVIEAKAKELVSGDVLEVRSGRGRSSITIDASRLPDSIAVGSPLGYMALQETGGTIRPKQAQLLTVPLEAAKTPRGVPRFTAREAASKYESTFWQKTPSGSLILFGRNASGIVPLFAGVKRVTLPPRPWLRPAFDRSLPRVAELVATELERGL